MLGKRDFRPPPAQSRPVLASKSTEAHRRGSSARSVAQRTRRRRQRRLGATLLPERIAENGVAAESGRGWGSAGDPTALLLEDAEPWGAYSVESGGCLPGPGLAFPASPLVTETRSILAPT